MNKAANPLISVIVPVYNVEKYLDACVSSIIGQTYSNLEIILVDDGSNDKSPSICDKYAQTDNRVKVIHKTNGGQSAARNDGINIAHGDFIGFIDSDDVIKPEFYQCLYDSITSERTLPSNSVIYIDENGNELSEQPRCERKLYQSKEYARSLLLYTGDCSVWSKLFPKHVFDEYRFDTTLLNEDYKFMTELALAGYSVMYTGYIGYCYRKRSGSTTASFGKSTRDTVKNCLDVGDEILKVYPDLKSEVSAFRLYQHMIYMLLYPKDTKFTDESKAVIKYMRNNILSNLGNKHLTITSKTVILMQCVMPRLPALAYRAKKKTRK